MARTASAQVQAVEANAFTNVGRYQSRMYCAFAFVETAIADAAGHIYELLRLPAKARLFLLYVVSDGVAGLTDVNVGLRTPANGADPVTLSADDVLADGVNLAAGEVIPNNALQMFSGTNGLAIHRVGERLWEMAGLAADPGGLLSLTMISVADPTAAGTIGVCVYYGLDS